MRGATRALVAALLIAPLTASCSPVRHLLLINNTDADIVVTFGDSGSKRVPAHSRRGSNFGSGDVIVTTAGCEYDYHIDSRWLRFDENYAMAVQLEADLTVHVLPPGTTTAQGAEGLATSPSIRPVDPTCRETKASR